MEFVSKDLTNRAVDMLLKGATLLSESCPYCKGVRVMKDGYALCVNCGREPEQISVEQNSVKKSQSIEIEESSVSQSTLNILKQKLETLSAELKQEKDHEKQQKILNSINLILEIIKKFSE